MKTNRLIRKSTALFMALAVFAMIFTGCSKDSSSSSSNSGGNSGGGGGGVVPPITDYGTVRVGDQTYTIALGAYEIYFDEDLQDNICSIAITDTSGDNTFSVGIPYRTDIPEGRLVFSIEDPIPDGKCVGMLTAGENNVLLCASGYVTITKVGTDYKIESAGYAVPIGGGRDVDFGVEFQGPLTQVEE